MQFIKKTWNRMIITIIVLTLLLWCTSLYITFYIGFAKGSIRGELYADMKNPLKAKVEAEKPFCYDRGVIYDVRKGKKVFIPEF